MITYQDYLRAVQNNLGEFVPERVTNFVQYAIDAHKSSDDYLIAKNADLYDRQRNVTINEYVRNIYTLAGEPVEDFTASNNKIASNFFHRLNTQRCTYSLGNGISFTNDPDGEIKKKLGNKFDNKLYDLAYDALIHKEAFGFWNVDKLHVFPYTQFVPLMDEFDGSLKAGIRFWQIDDSKPMNAVLYEIDGYTEFTCVKVKKENAKTEEDYDYVLKMNGQKQPYTKSTWTNEVGDTVEVLGETQYSSLPIIPMWGSKRKQSTLVGMQQAIDSFDLIRSGFANDLTDCAEIYWLIENYGGMTDEELAKFRDRLKINHIAEVATGNGGSVRPYTQEIPYQARKIYLEDIKAGIYEDFGALDVHQVQANSTNDHLEAAYQPMDEEADDFEFQIIEFVLQLLKIVGVENEDVIPIFKRNRISNQREQVEMVMQEAEYLDAETVLDKLPNITPDEVQEILKRKDKEDRERMPEVPIATKQVEDEDVEDEVIE